MPDFFIRRPIFAWVVALLISLMGLLAIPSLPIAQDPDIAPPVITLRTTYPGASAQDTEEAVTAVIEKHRTSGTFCRYHIPTSPYAAHIKRHGLPCTAITPYIIHL